MLQPIFHKINSSLLSNEFFRPSDLSGDEILLNIVVGCKVNSVEKIYLSYVRNANPNLLTPWGRTLLEKVRGPHLVKKIIRILWKSRFHYRADNNLPPVPILSQINPVHALSSLFKIHSNINSPIYT
jgi:hypothetical protein